MAAIVVKTGLRAYLADTQHDQLLLRLFSNNVAITPDTVVTDLTPAAFPGYADFDIMPSMSGVTIDGLGRAQESAPPVVFVRTAGAGSETEYGWALVRKVGATETLIAADTFSTPRTIDTAGQNIAITASVFYQGL